MLFGDILYSQSEALLAPALFLVACQGGVTDPTGPGLSTRPLLTVCSSGPTGCGAISGPVNVGINTAVTVGTIQFNSGAPAYNIAVNSNASLSIAGSGIVNNSSNPLTLTVKPSGRVTK